MRRTIVLGLALGLGILAQASKCRGDYELLVASSGTSEVLAFDGATGASRGTFVPSGSGGLLYPFGMTYGPDGDLYVTSPGTLGVKRYDGRTGAPAPASGRGGADFVAPGGGLQFPAMLAFGPDGNLFVTSASGAIFRYDGRTGDPLPAAGQPAGSAIFTAQGGLVDPASLVFAPDGTLLVADFGSSRVLRYDSTTGAYLGTLIGAGQGGLDGPNDIRYGPDGNLYLTSLRTQDVLRFDALTGASLPSAGHSGAVFAEGGLNMPLGLIFGPDGSLFVADDSNSGPAVLRFDGTTGAPLGTFLNTGDAGLSKATFLLVRAVPEPSAVLMLGAGIAGIPFALRRPPRRSSEPEHAVGTTRPGVGQAGG